MPQISKIRIVNFQYNDGKRLIADELYDFDSENQGPSDVLINLANGGGKSVLVQLMMQPIIPKAKVAGRRIESFFAKTSDHCYIAIEWVLDGSRMRLMTGIAMAASDSSSADTDSDRGFQIKHYTFISSYESYQNKYNIISLPLSGRENGRFVPASFDEVRNLAKRSGGALERYSSDDGIKWQERLAEYGIIQNEWRMIEELNSNEDGLSKYFSSLKTSDAVIDRLIVPRIEEKQNCSVSKDDSSLETMLLSYARAFAKQQDIIRERETCTGFFGMLASAKTDAEELWKSNDTLEKWIEKLFAYADALNIEIDRQREKSEQLTEERDRLSQEIRHIRWEKASAEYHFSKDLFDLEKENLKAAEETKNEAEERMEQAQKALLLLECAHYYEQLTELKNRVRAVSEEIIRRENHTEAAGKLAALKYSAYLAIREELERVLPELTTLRKERDDLQQIIAEADKGLAAIQKEVECAQKEKIKAETILEQKMCENDDTVEELQIGAFRMLDGSYQKDELCAWKNDMQKKEQAISEASIAAQKKLLEMEKRKDEIPQELADAGIAVRELQTDREAAEEKLSEYRSKESRIQSVFEKHGLDYKLRFTSMAADYLHEQITLTEALIIDERRRMEALEEALASAQRGDLHIPGMLTEYLDSTGLRYTSVEKYLLTQQERGNLSIEESLVLLGKYPFAAYGIIMDPEDRETVCSEVEGQWLPALLPVFTAEDLDRMLRGEEFSFASVAAYSKDYFRDNASYIDDLKAALEKKYDYIQLLEERMEALGAVKDFSAYDAEWENGMSLAIGKLEEVISGQQAQMERLRLEQAELRERIRSVQMEEKEYGEELNEIHSRLLTFEKLLIRLEEETTFMKNLDAAVEKLREFTQRKRRLGAEREENSDRLGMVKGRLQEEEAAEHALCSGLEKVSDAKETEIVDGEWRALLTQYDTLLESQSADLKRLNDEKNRLIADVSEKEKEIRKRNCLPEEYQELIYTEERERAAEECRRNAEIARRSAEEAYAKAGHSLGKAEASFEAAGRSLKDFGGEPLPKEEIGNAFDTRIRDIEKQMSDIDGISRSVTAALSKLEKVQGKTEHIIDQYSRPLKYSGITLEEDHGAQLDSISLQIREWKRAIAGSRNRVEEILEKMAAAYGPESADVRVAVSGMQSLLVNETVRGDRYYTLCEHMDANMHTVELRISQIDTDLREFHKTKGDLIRQCVIQGRLMYEGLQQLSHNSKVKVQNRRRQMIRFDIPDTVDENVAKAAIAAEIDKGTEEIVAKMAEDAYSESEVRKIAGRIVGSKRLLRKYTGMESIVLRAYKIDRNPDNSGYRTWEQTQVNNSGAEKFVVYFAVILALMTYTRDGYDALNEDTHRSVLILDNPFGPISSRHVLEPMFEISRNYHVQMICLSDISKSDIVSCFRLVIRAVVKRFALSSREQLTHEGNERIEHGFYRSEQMELFS